jgi:uncharacterized protein (TIGR00730 family)
MERVCVFCGSSKGGRSIYTEQTRALGQALATRGLELVFGAGHIGLMGVLADAVLEAGGRAIGVIPRALADKELAHRRLTRLHVVDTMHQRKALMADLADAFLALPGGYGTADELFEILTWAQLGIHRKPIGLLNTQNFFDSLTAWIDHMIVEGFVRDEHRALFLIEDDVDRLLDRLRDFSPGDSVEKWLGPSGR